MELTYLNLGKFARQRRERLRKRLIAGYFVMAAAVCLLAALAVRGW